MDINEFLTYNYTKILKMSKSICKCKQDTADELGHYVIEYFMMHDRAQELIDNNEAMKFMSGMLWRSYHSSTSPYHKLYRQSGKVYELYDSTAEELADEPYDIELDLTIESIQGILEDMESDTVEQWFRAKLFQMWLDEPNYSELSRKTGIPRTSISQAVNEAIDYIKTRVKDGTDY